VFRNDAFLSDRKLSDFLRNLPSVFEEETQANMKKEMFEYKKRRTSDHGQKTESKERNGSSGWPCKGSYLLIRSAAQTGGTE
jgi:hypothetical protein